MKTFFCSIKGVSALLHHRMTEESLMGLLGTKGGIKKDKVVKTPREIAEGFAYTNEEGFCIPLGYISGAFLHTAGDYKQKGSVRKSYKAIAAGIFRPLGEFATLVGNDGKPLSNFEVDIRKGTNHKVGAVICIRPRFDEWNINFEVEIEDDLISPEVALQILQDSGRRCGIGSFRVSKSGPFGRFSVVEWREITESEMKKRA